MYQFECMETVFILFDLNFFVPLNLSFVYFLFRYTQLFVNVSALPKCFWILRVKCHLNTKNTHEKK